MAVPHKDIDLGYKAFMKRLEKIHTNPGPDVVVGLMGDTAVEKHEGDTELTVVEIGAIHEFGAPEVGIPERSWLRAATIENEQKYLDMKEAAYGKAIDGTMDFNTGLALIGLEAEKDIREAMRKGIPPPLKRISKRRAGIKEGATSAERRQAREAVVPLIDTGQLIQAITSKVVQDGEEP